MSKRYIVTGAGGFIGTHMVRHLKEQGHFVVGVDVKPPRWSKSPADLFIRTDLRTQDNARRALMLHGTIDGIFMLAADMGGLGYMEGRDAQIMTSNALIDIHTLSVAAMMAQAGTLGRTLFTSSAVVYPEMDTVTRPPLYNPRRPAPYRTALSEGMAHPADPQEGGYGWEKLFTEQMCAHFAAAYPALDCRVARLHNCYGPEGSWNDGREKAPAALCRKVAYAVFNNASSIEVWGDGTARRSFMYIDDCTDGLIRLMEHNQPLPGPLNLGSEEMVTINQLAHTVMGIAGVEMEIEHVPGPVGVQGRNSDNTLLRSTLGWEPQVSLRDGLERTYQWIEQQIARQEWPI